MMGTLRRNATSCLPLIFKVWILPSLKLKVSCGLKMLEVGLTATFRKISLPFVIPPLIPPLLLDEVFPFLSIKQSLNLLPKNSVPLKPAPNSTPLIPGIEKSIDEITDSVEPKRVLLNQLEYF